MNHFKELKYGEAFLKRINLTSRNKINFPGVIKLDKTKILNTMFYLVPIPAAINLSRSFLLR